MSRFGIVLLLTFLFCINSLSAMEITGEFVIGAFHGPPMKELTLERYREIADAGIDMMIPWRASREYNLLSLDLAKQVGIKVIPVDARIMQMVSEEHVEIDTLHIRKVIADYGRHPAFAAYGVKDEPGAVQFEKLAQVCRLFRKYDPYNIAFVNLFPNYAESEQLQTQDYATYLREYLRIVMPAVLCYDHYPFRVEKLPETDWYGNLEVVRKYAHRFSIPFWIFIQSEGIRDGLRVPTQNELLWQAATAMAYGARGLLWFTYWNPPDPPKNLPKDAPATAREIHHNAMISQDGKKTDMYYQVRMVNHFIKQAGRSLVGWDNSYIAHYEKGEITTGRLPVIKLSGESFRSVVGTFTKGNFGRVLIVNDSTTEDGAVSIAPEKGFHMRKVIVSVRSEITETGPKQDVWTFGPAGLALLEYEKIAVTEKEPVKPSN